MRKFFLLLACLLRPCLGEDSPKCKVLFQYPEKQIETMKFPAEKRFSYRNLDMGECLCRYAIQCNEIFYCIFWRCPNGDMISAINSTAISNNPECKWFDELKSYFAEQEEMPIMVTFYRGYESCFKSDYEW